jgi:hypothetical protein
MILDNDKEERKPIEPKPTRELVRFAFVAAAVVDIYWAEPKPVTVDASSCGSMKLVI